MSQRIWTLLGALSCAALLCAAGCQKDRTDEPGGAGESATPDPGASRPIAVRAAPKVASSLPLDSWSPNTEALIGIDMVQFRQSPIGSIVDDWLRTVIAPAGCSDSVVERVSQVLVVTSSVDTGNPLYVLRGASKSNTKGCTSQPSVWLDDNTLAIAPSWEPDALAAETSGTNGRTNPRILAALSHIDTSAALWVAAAPPDPKQWGEDFTEMRGTIVLDGGLRTSIGVKYADADSAASAATTFEKTVKEMAPFTEYFEQARAYADGQWMKTEIVMSREQLERLPTDPMFAGIFPTPPPKQPQDPMVVVD